MQAWPQAMSCTGVALHTTAVHDTNITDNLNYCFQVKIKQRIKTRFKEVMNLPLSNSVDIVSLSDECQEVKNLPLSLSVDIVSLSDECNTYNHCCVRPSNV